MLALPEAPIRSQEVDQFQEQKVIIAPPYSVNNNQPAATETLPVTPETSVANDEDTARQLDTLLRPDWRSSLGTRLGRRLNMNNFGTSSITHANYAQSLNNSSVS